MSTKTSRGGGSRPVRRFRDRTIIASLVLITVVVYSRTLFNGFVNYDDPMYVTENRHVQEGLTLDSIRWALLSTEHSNWHPLTWVSLQLDFVLYELKPAGYHATSVLLHACNTALVFWILRRTTGAVWASALTAAFFSLHPLRVQSVGWIAERKDVISGLFWLLTLAAYGRYALRPTAAAYALTLVLFVFGLASKAMVVTLPFVLLLWDYWPLNRWSLTASFHEATCLADGVAPPKPLPLRWLLLEKLPMFVLTAGCSWLTILAQRLSGALSPVETLSIGKRLAHIPVAYFEYLFKTIWPSNLAVYYPYQHLRFPLVYGCLAAAALAIITAWAVRRRREPYLAVGWLWFVGTLVPVIGLLQVGGQEIADRYTYIPSIGLCIAFVWWADRLARRDALTRQMAVAAGMLVLASYAATAWTQVRHWHDSITLWRHALEVVGPESYVCQGFMGGALVEGGHDAEAIPYLTAAIRAGQHYEYLYTSLGLALFRLGRYEESQVEFEKAIALHADDDKVAYNLGCVRLKLRDTAGAIAAFKQTVSSDPAHWRAHLALAELIAIQGNAMEAQQHFERAITINRRQALAVWRGSHPDATDASALALRVHGVRGAARAGNGD